MPVRSARAASSGELLLAGLLDDPIELLERADRALDAHRVADLDGGGQRRLSGDRARSA